MAFDPTDPEDEALARARLHPFHTERPPRPPDPRHHPGNPQHLARGKHHPCFDLLGPGWAWFADYYSTRYVWLHVGGLHIICGSRPDQLHLETEDAGNLSEWHASARWAAIAAALNTGVGAGLTGYHLLRAVGTLDAPVYELVRGTP